MKTNITRNHIVALLFTVVLPGCRTEDVMTFEPTDCVYFATADTTRFSFGLLDNPDAQSAVFTISVNLAGKPADRDREFHAGVLKDAENSQTRYEIVSPSLVKAGESTGTIEIKVWQTPNLDNARDAVTIVLRGSGDLIADFADRSTHCVTFYNRIDRPSWWTANYERDYAGKYHEIKMQVLRIVLGSMNDPRNDIYAWPYYQMILNNYCVEHDLRYPEDNTEIRFAPNY